MKNIEKQINSRHILQIPELILHHGERIGIVGSNGVGKTTLLRMIIQEDNDYKGMITVNGDIAYVPQVKEIRDGSGGEISLKLLKEAFSSRTSILILDEPTSHLDQHNVQWLIHRISKFDGTIILVSHDRFLLDNIIEKIVFIERSQIGVFKGNFTEFENERNQIEEQCWKNIAQYNNEVARLTKELENKKIRSKKLVRKVLIESATQTGKRVQKWGATIVKKKPWPNQPKLLKKD
ncbi:ATP-binding cassette domain-containing protein [Streptococcus pneumoniae]|nr:ATP-binding cassette domain-containing protein [Streptococcus pneumoniae]